MERLLEDSADRSLTFRVDPVAGLAAWPSVAALSTTVVALGWITVVTPEPTALVAEALRVLLALTVPHMVVVLWLDRSSLPSR